MTNKVAQIRVLEEKHNIFDTDKKYIIPLYQRAYAWENKQIIQLLEDIDDVSEDADYYIGSLIVADNDDKYEVVDGQQRLTSLYLLMSCLGIKVKNSLLFECREKSNYSLRNLDEIINDEESKIDMDQIEEGIHRGVSVIKNELLKPKYENKELFIKKLYKIVIFQIKVPEHTDLNRYFEIMNTRGEQLEQHDILKASLMSELKDRTDEYVFAKMWNACSDMTGYVQMHFVSDKNVERTSLFGWMWNEIPTTKWNEYIEVLKDNNDRNNEYTINSIIEMGPPKTEQELEEDPEKRVRFESIVEFSYFLIHVLKVFISVYNIKNENSEKDIIPELLDDKKLVNIFEYVIEHGIYERKINRASGSDLLKEIPEYKGNIYIEVNGNIPYFTDNDIVSKTFESYSEPDLLGRTGPAIACLGHELMPTEEREYIGMIKPSGWVQNKYQGIVDSEPPYLYNRCHLIAYMLTGQNANENNLITGTRYFNTEGMLPFEIKVADYIIQTGNHVMYRVTPIYDGSDLLAKGVQMEAHSVEDNGKGVKFNVFIYNVQPGIRIDYSTGDNWAE